MARATKSQNQNLTGAGASIVGGVGGSASLGSLGDVPDWALALVIAAAVAAAIVFMVRARRNAVRAHAYTKEYHLHHQKESAHA